MCRGPKNKQKTKRFVLINKQQPVSTNFSVLICTNQHALPDKLFQTNPHCYCCFVVAVIGGDYGDGGVAA